ncbi:hypothetical protein E1B28_002669 [Marasmius oreades]|uniref:Crinkler (CRN) family protein n=1 Tax=Marasmius oreades TaxID=181124 RepID=A0A9P7RP64_9AGAR|nr:uncharacterized protein E1B28_002669 [Marasmius oreades]KAG7086736.1 hypothetical protein E1B28_002669 [Marasmius oreades]
MTSLEGLISPDVSDGGPLMAPDLICNYIDDFTNEAPYSDNSGYCTLHEIAWKNKDRSALFEDVVGSYKSLKIFVKFTDGFQERLLVTPEYKVALSDAKLWFDGQEVPKTTFTQQDSYWMPTKDEDEGEDQQMASDDEDQQMDSDDKRESRHMGTDDGPDWPTSSEAQGAFIVCGIPGIGKSSFLYYVLVERLLANLPTCFQTEPDVFTYWCDKGVFRCKLERTETGFLIPSRVWFLVDSNKKIEEPDTKILNTHARVIQAASPRKNRLDWTRKRSIFTYIWYMKPSPLSELLIMKQFWPRKPSDEQVTKFVANYGPSARLIAGFAHATDEYGEQL